MRPNLVAALLLLSPAAIFAEQTPVIWGGGPKDMNHGECITPELRQQIQQRIDAYIAEHGENPNGPSRGGGSPALYPFYPQAGIFWGDIFANNFVDMDGTAGIEDYDCSEYTYDGHHGIDTDIVTWNQKNLGVPIYAALGGTVVASDDGHFDEQTTLNVANMPNYVILDHGGGHFTWYFHMKTGSVAVAVTDVVKAGQQLGLTASSGYSTGPHLHFESRFAGNHYEPFSGTCGPMISGWENQTPFERGMYLREFNVTAADLTGWGGPPVDTTRTGYFETGVRNIYFWFVVQNLAANAPWQIRLLRPDTSVALNSGPQNLGNGFSRWSSYWFFFNVNLNVTGTWTLEYTLDGDVTTAPIEVVASMASAVNRAPSPVNSVSFVPAAPEDTDAIRCLADAPLILRDADYDQVAHRFVWEVNDVVVRDVTIAALSDMLPAGTAEPGDTVECICTATDGADPSTPVSNSVMIAGGPPAASTSATWESLE